MTEFFDAATTPVALVFGVPLAVSVVLWMVSASGIFDFDGESGDGAFEDAFESVGMAGVPPLVVVTVVSLIGWFISVVAALFLLDRFDGAVLLGASGLVLILGLAAGIYLGARIARPIGSMLETARAPRDADLIGCPAVIRSGTVDEMFGYADATWTDGGVSRVDVRAPAGRALRAGEQVRLIGWDPDARVYQVVREREIFNETGDG